MVDRHALENVELHLVYPTSPALVLSEMLHERLGK